MRTVANRRLPLALLAAMAGAMPALAQNQSQRPRFGPPWPEDTRPVTVNLPREYDPMLNFVPSATGRSSAGVFVEYPGLQPWPFLQRPRCRVVCDGELLITFVTGDRSEMARSAWRFLRDLEAANGPYAVTALPPPPGYTRAWHKEDRHPPGLGGGAVESDVSLREAPDGAPLEFAECATRLADPARDKLCVLATSLDANPAVHIEVTFTAEAWPERDAIRAAVMRLVGSWL